MRVLMLSKACVVGQYQSKLEALAAHDDIELTVMVPPAWKDERGILTLERVHTNGYDLRVEPIALNGHFHLHFYPTLSQVISQVQPDVVHIDEEPYNLATFLATRQARRSGAQVLFFTWQNIPHRYPPPFAWFESYTLASCLFAIAGNQEAAGVLRGKGFKGALSVIPQFGIDPLVYTPAERGPTARADFRIGFVGRFVKEKGPDLLLRALATIPDNWHLVMLGSGPLKDELHTLASDLGISSRVNIEPWRPSTEMPDFYRTLDLLVIPSISRPNWKEQFGRVLIEGMACEVPVIGSSCGEIPNVIADAGIVFKEGDVEALRTAIQGLVHDPSRCLELQKLGRERVLTHYTQAIVAEHTYRVYKEAAQSRSALLSDMMRI